MKNPQSQAEELSKVFPNEKLNNIAKYGCCAFVLIWCLGLDPSDIDAILLVERMIDKKVIDKDCTVNWDKAVKYLSGRSLKSVEFRDITVIKGIKERTPVRYDFNGKSHWVGVENGEIKFNSLISSVCVNKGRPVTARILTLNVER